MPPCKQILHSDIDDYCGPELDRVYIIGGGYDENSQFECWKLDLEKWRFVQMKNMFNARHGHSVCSLSNDFIVVSGSKVNQAAKSVELYDATKNYWHLLPSLNEGRYYHASCEFNSNTVYVFCGISIERKNLHLHSIEKLELLPYFQGQKKINWQTIEHIPTPDYLGALGPR